MNIKLDGRVAVYLSVTLIAIMGFMVYANSVGGKFIWDDEILVVNNAYIKGPSSIKDIFAKDIYAGSGGERSSFYRPLQAVTYLFDYSIWGLNAKGYHLTNIFLHIITALLIYWLVNILYGNKLLSFLAGIFFAVHPVHTEVVSYISGRTDSLATLFILLSFIFYIKSMRSGGMVLYLFMVLSFISALLSRETSLILIALLLLYHYAFKTKLKTRHFITVLGISAFYVLLRFTLLRSLFSFIPPASTTLPQRIPGFFVAITNYIRILFLPFNLHMEYGKSTFSLYEAKALLGILITVFLAVYVFKKRKKDNLVFFSVSWFFVTLFPVSNLYPINAYMAEHWLYLPSIGFFVILARALEAVYRDRKLRLLSVVFILLLLSFYSYLTVRQNNYWNNPVSFYERTLKDAPESARIYYNLGVAYAGAGQSEKAIAAYKRAIELDAGYTDAYCNLGVIYSMAGENKKAEELYNKTLEINPNHPNAHNNLGLTYYQNGQYDLALEHFEKAIELGHKISPEFIDKLKKYNK